MFSELFNMGLKINDFAARILSGIKCFFELFIMSGS